MTVNDRLRDLIQSKTAWTVAALGLAAVISLFIWGPEFWMWLRKGEDPSETYSATLRNIGLLIAGIIALPLALWRSIVAHSQAKSAQGQLVATQQSLRQERFQRGVEMLGNELLSTRMGGIYALLGLAEDYPEEFHLQVMKSLCAFVRNPYGIDKPMDQDVTGWEDVYMAHIESIRSVPFREDVQAIIHAIGNRGPNARYLEQSANFHPNLNSANFTFADLTNVDLSATDLTGALFIGAKCQNTNFSDALLRYANFYAAKCFDANMWAADLQHAKLVCSTMNGSDFSNTNLEGTIWLHADLSLVKFCRAQFIDAYLAGATLDKADLSGATFETHFNSYTGLTQEQLDRAKADPEDPPHISHKSVDLGTRQQLVWRN